MLTDDWDSLSLDTLERAIEDRYSEGKELEFKAHQNPGNTGHKKTTVGEVVSFANSMGGDLVIGISDEEGEATGLWPADYDDVDETINRWVNIIKRNTDPEIPQHLIDISPIEVTDEASDLVDKHAEADTGYVLVVRVQRSWRAPHRETVGNHFYERSSGGKTELDTGAIRRAMFQGEILTERAREFRDDRLAAIRADNVAIPVNQGPKVVLHVVPSNAFSINRMIDPATASRSGPEEVVPSILHPRAINSGWSRYTEDGYLIARPGDDDNLYRSYTLTFRSGVIEAVTTSSYQDEGTYIHSGHVRNCLEASLETYVEFLNESDAQFPIYAYMSVVGAAGMPVGTQRTAHQEHDELNVIDREIARLPAVQIRSPPESLDSDIDELLDSIYHASGMAQEMRVQ